MDTMLLISVSFSLVMLVVVNCLAYWRKRVGLAVLVAWAFLLVGCWPPTFMLTYVLNVFLVASGGLICFMLQAQPRFFLIWSLVATLAGYGGAVYLAVERVDHDANLYPYESLDERLSYESRRDELPHRLGLRSPGEAAASFDTGRLASIERGLDEDVYHPPHRTEILRQMHEQRVVEFIHSPSFGVGRMGYYAEPPRQVILPMSELGMQHAEKKQRLDPDGDGLVPTLSWRLHYDSVTDFLSPLRFGYVKDRQHVAGFVPHQFERLPAFSQDERVPQRYDLRRLELVSLLKHEEPGVYVTENLPRMDLLNDVPIRSLDDFERSNLRRLLQGEDLAVDQQGDRLRVLGAIRAGKQCLSCHDAQRGELLGAFSYHLVAVH